MGPFYVLTECAEGKPLFVAMSRTPKTWYTEEPTARPDPKPIEVRNRAGRP